MVNGRDCYCGHGLTLSALWTEPQPKNARIIPDVECNISCPGDFNEKCGGENNLNIFTIQSKCQKERDDGPQDGVGVFVVNCTETGEFEPRQSWGSTGQTWCVDMNGDRVNGTLTEPGQDFPICNPYYTGQCVSNQYQTLTLTVSGDSMTRESCKITCDSEDSTYFGLGNGRDCYCGNTVDDNLILLPFPMCGSPCSGDANEMCGGVEAFNLYSLKEKENIPPLA